MSGAVNRQDLQAFEKRRHRRKTGRIIEPPVSASTPGHLYLPSEAHGISPALGVVTVNVSPVV